MRKEAADLAAAQKKRDEEAAHEQAKRDEKVAKEQAKRDALATVLANKATTDKATKLDREIAEISSGILAFDAEFLVGALPRLTNDNAKGEFYLTDTVRIAREDGLTVGAFAIDDVRQTEGANDRVQLAAEVVDAEPDLARRDDLDGARRELVDRADVGFHLRERQVGGFVVQQ